MYKKLSVAAKLDRPDAIAVAIPSDAKKLPEQFKGLDAKLGGLLSAAMKRGEYCSDAGTVLTIHPAKGAQRAYLVGLGRNGASPRNALRVGCSKLTLMLHAAGVKAVSIHVPKDLGGEDDARAIGEGFALGNLRYIEHKGIASDNGKPTTPAGKLTIHAAGVRSRGVERGIVTGESANIARSLVATPPNVAHPAYIARYAKKIAERVGLKCTLIDYAKAKSLGMGGLCAVGQAGSTKPVMILLEHRPHGAASNKPPIALVGKAITFDTGGYSLKPGTSMVRMKYDKSGGMAVIAAMHALAKLKVKQHVVGVIAAAENMVDTDAYRPDDILTMYNGVTVEVTNTDAEGRLVLADALAYACEKYKPAAIVDLATLTGGVVVALGKLCAGCFCGDKALRTKLFDAGEAVGERLWHLPLWPEHKKMMRGEHGDIANSAGRDAHPIQGAAFLSYFVAKDGDFKKKQELPWAHLDIAGVADVETDRDASGLLPKGPSGFGVRLLVKMVEDWS